MTYWGIFFVIPLLICHVVNNVLCIKHGLGVSERFLWCPCTHTCFTKAELNFLVFNLGIWEAKMKKLEPLWHRRYRDERLDPVPSSCLSLCPVSGAAGSTSPVCRQSTLPLLLCWHCVTVPGWGWQSILWDGTHRQW